MRVRSGYFFVLTKPKNAPQAYALGEVNGHQNNGKKILLDLDR
jgi:hypothetical protein